jgi:hypothetical protein
MTLRRPAREPTRSPRKGFFARVAAQIKNTRLEIAKPEIIDRGPLQHDGRDDRLHASTTSPDDEK